MIEALFERRTGSRTYRELETIQERNARLMREHHQRNAAQIRKEFWAHKRRQSEECPQ